MNNQTLEKLSEDDKNQLFYNCFFMRKEVARIRDVFETNNIVDNIDILNDIEYNLACLYDLLEPIVDFEYINSLKTFFEGEYSD